MYVFFSFAHWKPLKGLQHWIAGLRGGSSGNAGWLVGCFLKQKPAGLWDTAGFPPPRAALVQIQKISRVGVKRKRQTIRRDTGKKKNR